MKAVVLAAGEGVRLRPLTLTRPKHLIPIGGRPLLEHLLRRLKVAGIEDVLLVVGEGGEAIKERFGDGSRLGLRIDYFQQPHPLGTGDALKLAEDFVEDQPFLTIYGDLYFEGGVVERLREGYERRGGMVMGMVEVGRPEDYGILKLGGEERVLGIVEKPPRGEAPSNLANGGVYVFDSQIFEWLRGVTPSPRGEIEATDAINALIEGGGRVFGVRIRGEEWQDIGRPWDILDANEKCLRGIAFSVEGVVEGGVVLKGAMGVEKGAVIKSGSYIEGPVLICEGAEVGPHAYLRPYTTIGRGVKVGASCEVKNSIIMDHTHIPHLSYVGDSVVGEGCNLGAGTITANIRHDEKPIKMLVKDKVVDTGRRKLGAIIGDGVKTGINVSLMPGVKIGPRSQIGPGLVVYRDIPPNTKVILNQELAMSERGKDPAKSPN